jgi:hypothetical protein
MIDLLSMVIAVGVGGASLFAATRLQRRWDDRVDAVWQTTARQVAGEFRPFVENGRDVPHRRIDATIDEVEITAEGPPRTGDIVRAAAAQRIRRTSTVVRAKAKAPPDLGIAVERVGFITMGKLFESNDVSCGDADFDAQFTVRSNDRARTRVWLAPRVRRGMIAIRDWRFGLEAGEVIAERLGVEQDGNVLGRVLRVVALFARRGVDAMGEWRALAKSLHGEIVPLEPVWDLDCTLRVPRLGVDVSVCLVDEGGQVVTRLQATSLAARKEGEVRGSEDLEAILASLPIASLARDGLVRLDLRDVVLDAGSLDVAVEVVARLALGAVTGPYR